MKDSMNRRRFLKAGALSITGAPLLAGCASSPKDGKCPSSETISDPTPETDPAKTSPGISSATESSESPRILKFNPLGDTGLMVSDISLGGAREASVLRYALDRGVNLYDTAEQYFSGQHEADIGRAFRDVRDRVIVVTKHLHGMTHRITKKDVIDRFDASLKRMGFDYIDVAMIHHLDDPKTLENEELLDAYDALKRAGKYRFLGFSTHKAEDICPAAFDSGLFEVMLLIYNSVQYPDRSEMITRARELGIGVMAMKTMAGTAAGSDS